jgi:hypothetical protein
VQVGQAGLSWASELLGPVKFQVQSVVGVPSSPLGATITSKIVQPLFDGESQVLGIHGAWFPVAEDHAQLSGTVDSIEDPLQLRQLLLLSCLVWALDAAGHAQDGVHSVRAMHQQERSGPGQSADLPAGVEKLACDGGLGEGLVGAERLLTGQCRFPALSYWKRDEVEYALKSVSNGDGVGVQRDEWGEIGNGHRVLCLPEDRGRTGVIQSWVGLQQVGIEVMGRPWEFFVDTRDSRTGRVEQGA